jgi:hypothetical protein
MKTAWAARSPLSHVFGLISVFRFPDFCFAQRFQHVSASAFRKWSCGRWSRGLDLISVFCFRNSCFWLCAFSFQLSAFSAAAQTNLVTPAQYLASQPKPNFAVGYHLPHLTRWGWQLSSNACVELAQNWGYTLDLGWAQVAAPNLKNSNSYQSGFVALAKGAPSKYVLSVLINKSFPAPIPDGFYCTNSNGWFVDKTGSNFWRYATNTLYAPVVSPEGPDGYWQAATAYWMNQLAMIQSNAPISIILNGGEYGLRVPGWDVLAWKQDARVQQLAVMTNPWSTTNMTGMSWPRYCSDRKAHQLGFLTSAIQKQLPNRELYIFYSTGAEQYRTTYYYPYWFDKACNWGWNSDVMVTNTDYPSFENYYEYHGWTNTGTNPFQDDILTRHMNAVGYNINLGHPLNYSWVCGGWGGDGVPNTNYLSDIPRYIGFLKCLYTSGMVGGIAGYFAYPSGNDGTTFGGPGFDAPFPTNSPPHWLLQIVALAQVHALFSHLESYLYNGDLLSGPQPHAMSADQRAYEFTNTVADATARVLARKLRDSNQWLVTAWAATGANRNVTVNIPGLGPIAVLARDSGAVYQVTTTNTTLIDLDGMLPTASFATLPAPPTNLRVLNGNGN